jgi:acyl dehydratase
VESLYFEDFRVGTELETSSRVVDEEAVFAFADVSGDRNPLHLDPEYARAGAFGERVAHGVLGLAVATGLLNQSRLTRGTLVALLGLTWDFVAPIRLGTAVTVRIRVDSTRRTSRPDRGIVVLAASLVDAGGAELQRGTFKMLVRRRPAAPRPPGAGAAPPAP